MKQSYRLIRFRTRQEWLDYRKTKITATEAGAVLGDSPWMSAFDVYLKLTKGVEKYVAESTSMTKGNEAEPILREIFQNQHKEYKVVNPPKGNWIVENRELPWMCATPDGLLRQHGKVVGGLECKWHEIRGSEDTENWTSGKLPQQYFEQVLWTMIAGGFREYYLIAWLDYYGFDGKTRRYDHTEVRTYTFYADDIKADLEYEKTKVKDFYENNVLKRVPPEMKITF